MSTKKWKEEIQNVGRRAMQLSYFPTPTPHTAAGFTCMAR
jgi:hypothetical protein